MKRQVRQLEDGRFDVVVIGGGVLGACVARDCAMRGLATALVDASDFASATSSNSLKVIHGGLRHLQHGDLVELRRSARERAHWLRIAPHLVQPMPVVLPLVGHRLEPWLYRGAVAINDVLTAERNRYVGSGQEIPDGRRLSRAECLDRLPGLDGASLKGGVLYHDALMYSSERLVLAVVRSAVEHGAVVANHVECIGPLLEGGRRVGVELLDRLDGSRFALRARAVVNAAGPGASRIESRILGRAAAQDVPLSLAWNFVLDASGLRTACGLPGMDATPTARGGRRPRRLFFVPWRGRTLVGTGHDRHAGDPRDFVGMDHEHPALLAFLEEVNSCWFGDPFRPEDVRLVHAGLLPAHSGSGEKEVHLRRRHVLTETDAGGVPVLTVLTVKFTAGRRLGELVTDRVCRVLRHQAPCRTATTPLPGAPSEGMPAFLSDARKRIGSVLDADVLDHLAHAHGTDLPAVLAGAAPEHLARVAPRAPVIEAQWIHAIREEMAVTVDDLVLRRTELGARALVDDAVRERAARILAAESRAVCP